MLAATAQTVEDELVMEVETIRTLPGFLCLKDEWCELQCSSDATSLFLSWEWLYTWWKELAEDRELWILAVRGEGKLMAVAPFCRRPASLRVAGAIPVVEFLGSGTVGSDYLDVIVRHGWELQAREALASHLCHARPVLRWTNVAANTSSAARVSALLGDSGWNVREATTNVCPFITLAGKSWEDYLASLGAEHRYNFHRKWRRLNRDYAVSFDQAATEAECGESIDLAMQLHRLRWSEHGESEAFHTPQVVAFHRSFARLALQRGWLRLYILRLNGKPAACLYGFLYGEKFYFYQSGFDPAFEKYSVGMICMGLGIQKAVEEGASEYDMLHGAEPYKFHWARESREIVRFELYPPGRRGWLSRSIVELERASRRLARRALVGSR
jgi:CelD/BcsL family acetyltransferase involved in cellulose biosynthesis